MDEGVDRVTAALQRLQHPDWPVPDPVTMYALSRALMGALRAASEEDHPALDDPRFEEVLVRMVTGTLHQPGGRVR